MALQDAAFLLLPLVFVLNEDTTTATNELEQQMATAARRVQQLLLLLLVLLRSVEDAKYAAAGRTNETIIVRVYRYCR
jgi:hypothetical protein